MTEQEIKDKYLKIHDALDLKSKDAKDKHDAIWAKCDIELMENGYLSSSESVDTSPTNSKKILRKELISSYHKKADVWLDKELERG